MNIVSDSDLLKMIEVGRIPLHRLYKTERGWEWYDTDVRPAEWRSAKCFKDALAKVVTSEDAK